MPGRITLSVIGGPIMGREFAFTSHDTLLFGRGERCHARLPESDTSASRLHFLLEANPPAVRVRDLGSRNGTFVNGRKIGARADGESPEQGQRRDYPQVDLADGDVIEVGETRIRVGVVAPPTAPAETTPPRRASGMGLLSTAAPTPPASMRVEILRQLGAGAMGAVYLARRVESGELVAVKLMLPQVADDESMRRLFLREIDIGLGLRHPNIVAIHEVGQGSEGFFFLMEYCHGGSVGGLQKERGGRLPLAEAAAVIVSSLEGLAFAHERKVVHRDLKPDNLLLATPGGAHVKVSDFGLAKNFELAGYSGMTAAGTFGGTPLFMAREQITDFRMVKPSTDVWAIAATFYYLLTGQPVRDFTAGRDPMLVILADDVVPIRRRDPSIPARVAAVIDRALADEPVDRYPDAGALQRALVEVL